MKRYTFYFVSGGSFSATGYLLTSDDEYIIKDRLGARNVFPKAQILRYTAEARI